MSLLRLLGSLLLLRNFVDGTILSVEDESNQAAADVDAPVGGDATFSLRNAAVSALRQLEDDTMHHGQSLRDAAVSALKQLDHFKDDAVKQLEHSSGVNAEAHAVAPSPLADEPPKPTLVEGAGKHKGHGHHHRHKASHGSKQGPEESIPKKVAVAVAPVPAESSSKVAPVASAIPSSAFPSAFSSSDATVAGGRKDAVPRATLAKVPSSEPAPAPVTPDRSEGDVRGVCSGWSPEWGAMKGLGAACKHWGWQTQWCWVPLDYNGPGHERVEESEEYVGKLFAPCGEGRAFPPFFKGARDHLTRFLVWAPIVFSLAAFGVLICAVVLRWRAATEANPANPCPPGSKHDPRMRHLWRPSLNKGNPRKDSLISTLKG